VLVVDAAHRLLGTFTDGDLRRKLGSQGGGRAVHSSPLTSATAVLVDATTQRIAQNAFTSS
jgi:CBS domain-containing protein